MVKHVNVHMLVKLKTTALLLLLFHALVSLCTELKETKVRPALRTLKQKGVGELREKRRVRFSSNVEMAIIEDDTAEVSEQVIKKSEKASKESDTEYPSTLPLLILLCICVGLVVVVVAFNSNKSEDD